MLVRADGRPLTDEGVNVAVSTKMDGDQTGPCTRHEVAIYMARVGQQIANGFLQNHRALATNDDILKAKLDQVIEEFNVLKDRLTALGFLPVDQTVN